MITEADFHKRVEGGEKLIVLDDVVLDVSAYMKHHPGGQFVLEHLVGKDVSKFFYGGYSLDSVS